ncbi:hypothetical protein [Methanospirillum lacunae]|uniref:SHOCT domain-containing protein n=1 Tax=Methanospirillum lacunae TaxID=668570 RepID=A0A2V2MZY7_9EURY|nr:hypothetical protein DK846_05505 [Methanospirillum lacunae]
MNDVLWLVTITGIITLIFIVSVYLISRRVGDMPVILTEGGKLNALHGRFVQGEITIDQYQDQRRELEKHNPENIILEFSRYN